VQPLPRPPKPPSHHPSRRALGALGVALAAFAPACLPPRQHSVTLFPAAQALGGERPVAASFADAKPEDAVVSVVAGTVSCTGTLVAEDLVLTAHHCVSARDARGRATAHDDAPGDVLVQLGDGDLPWAEVGVKAIVAPPCGFVSGRGDIALLVLERRLIGIPVIAPRLDEPPKKGEVITPFGFGRCAMRSKIELRVQRDGGTVGRVEHDAFAAPASICPGDSGGPALIRWTERRGGESVVVSELVGVVSASAMDADDRTEGTTVFTRVDVWRGLFADAREIANGTTPSELPPRSCD
jgi:hypothetical protein